ncbi:hypothetical protein BH23BAC2_BH23BAC2_16310 [soil metagenome]
MKISILYILLLSSPGIFAQEKKAEILSPEVQINTAVLAAPEDERSGVMVYGYDKDGKMIILREGSNNLICLADDPNKPGISVSCYSKKLEPFMARGRELTAEGKSEMEKREIRKNEAEEGKLELTDVPGMVYVLSGLEENYNKNTGELKDAKFRYVIYIPYATTESTGLPSRPEVPGMPWLMDPGTHRAHIMISPVNN